MSKGLEHQVLVEKPDLVEAIREQDIKDDDHHNVETVNGNGEQEDDDKEYEVPPSQVKVKTESNGNEYVEEVSDPSTGFYQKKVVRNGPGFQSVTIVSSGSASLGGDIIG